MIHEKLQNILITGGAGFIGSALVPSLLTRNYHVTAVDHRPKSKLQSLEPFFSVENFEFVRIDLLDEKKLKDVVKRCDLIFHLSANVDVRKGHHDTEIDFVNNIVATRNILESMRSSDMCKKIIFTSSSVVYGEPTIFPTPENYGPLKPISLYGASKLACEALISGYAGMFGMKGVIFRLGNIVGPSSSHGVIFDFFRKLKQSDGKYLEILGNGRQKKSYLYIDDCIDALTIGLDEFDSNMEIFNVGSDDQIDTNTIAQMIIAELGLDTVIRYPSDQKDGGGWAGDVKNMLLSTDRIKKRGWKNNHSSRDSVHLTIKNIAHQDQWLL